MHRIQVSRSGLLVAVFFLVVGSLASFGMGQLLARQTHAAVVASGARYEDQRSGPVASVGGSLGSQAGHGGQGSGKTRPQTPSSPSGSSGVSVTQSGNGQTITVSSGGSSVTITQNGSGTSVSVTSG